MGKEIYMDFILWEPIYERILEDFGFDREGDEKAALFLSSMLTEENTASPSELKALISGKPVLVCGNAPKLRDDLSETFRSSSPASSLPGAGVAGPPHPVATRVKQRTRRIPVVSSFRIRHTSFL